MTGSVVTVQLGQCGNQVGAELFDTLSNEIDAHPSRDRAGIRRAFFREPHRDDDSDAGFNSDDVASTSSRKTPVARAVLIDMEPRLFKPAFGARERRGDGGTTATARSRFRAAVGTTGRGGTTRTANSSGTRCWTWFEQKRRRAITWAASCSCNRWRAVS